MVKVVTIHALDEERNAFCQLLQEAGNEVFPARSSLEGIRIAQKEQPDLILVDVDLPELDGFEVTLRLRGMPLFRNVPIVLFAGESQRQTVLAVGATGVITKPVKLSQLAQEVERFLQGHKEMSDETGEFHLREHSQRIVERLEHKVMELRTANERMLEMARLRREFLQNVSHELATPMTPVVGYLRLLLGGELGALTPLQQKSLRSMEASVQRLRSLIETLLDISSLENERMHYYERSYDLAEVVNQALQEMRAHFEDCGVNLLQAPFPAGLTARGDPDKLRRSLLHILDNAAKFTPRGEDVGIAIKELQQKDPKKPTYAVTIVDQGSGVAHEKLSKIMEAFYQADGSATRSFGGVGLGLAFAKRVSEALGGGIEIHSPPIETVAGKTFRGTSVTLKVAAEPTLPNRVSVI